LTVGALVKLFRAVDKWSGSIAVYGTKQSDLFAWGIVDQLVATNVSLNRERTGGYVAPGVFAITIGGMADISVYHGRLFLGRLKQQELVWREVDALRSHAVFERVAPQLTRAARAIAIAVDAPAEWPEVLGELFDTWASTVARICIGLRRIGTGGSLLMSPAPITQMLDIPHRFRYRRLGDSLILATLETRYFVSLEEQITDGFGSLEYGPESIFVESSRAEADMEDREQELTSAVKLTTSLATTDGLVLLDPTLRLIGFGVKIRGGTRVDTVYDGAGFATRGTRARRIDTSGFGTRHGSMLRYCRVDRRAIGVVVSQDGDVRLILPAARSLTLWNNVQLLSHEHNVSAYARAERYAEQYRKTFRRPTTLGYTRTPKTIRALLALAE
jgi:hypothetical protein